MNEGQAGFIFTIPGSQAIVVGDYTLDEARKMCSEHSMRPEEWKTAEWEPLFKGSLIFREVD